MQDLSTKTPRRTRVKGHGHGEETVNERHPRFSLENVVTELPPRPGLSDCKRKHHNGRKREPHDPRPRLVRV
jgi:hypothetical protein